VENNSHDLKRMMINSIKHSWSFGMWTDIFARGRYWLEGYMIQLHVWND